MRSDFTYFVVLLDRSGSMESCVNDVIGGYNEWLRKQRQVQGKALITLVQFDGQDPQEVVYFEKQINEAPDLNHETFVPRGNTPLYDAFGIAAVKAGERLAAMAEVDRPGKVIFLCITDGENNASREYDKAKIGELIKKQQEVFSWDFVFIGADFNAMQAGSQIGLLLNNSLNSSKKNIIRAFAATADNMATYRGTGNKVDLQYTVAQRQSVADDKN